MPDRVDPAPDPWAGVPESRVEEEWGPRHPRRMESKRAIRGIAAQVTVTQAFLGLVVNQSTSSTVDVTLGTISLAANSITIKTILRITVRGHVTGPGGTGTYTISGSPFALTDGIQVNVGKFVWVSSELVFPAAGASGTDIYSRASLGDNGAGPTTGTGPNAFDTTVYQAVSILGHVSVGTNTLTLDEFLVEELAST